MDIKPRTLRMDEDPFQWLKQQAGARGLKGIGEMIELLVADARAEEAATKTQDTSAPVLQRAVDEAMGRHVERLAGLVEGLSEATLMEATRARMTTEEHLAYHYDGDVLVCPHCQKAYQPAQGGASFARQRSGAIADKARAALAAGRTPTLKEW